ncbi:MAG: sugar phosphate isomerase/epimerase [Bryobacteraceae bacterium]|nr:sugar phosphate isomerase/epimerase [Bryobacteraceae bacterium]
MMDRRRFLALSAAAAPLLRGATFDKPLGINLYTVRDVLAHQPAKTYQALAGLGIERLEVRESHLRGHAEFIRRAGLQPVHMFVDSGVITGDWSRAAKSDSPRPTLAGLAPLAKQFGIRRLGLSYLMPGERPTAVARINEAVEQLESLGLGFYYHNHAWEFEGAAGDTFMDRLLRESHPKLRLELDLFWATVGGEDVVRMLGQWKGRVASLHVKDVAADAPRQKSESNIPRAAFKEVGAGILEWPRVLKAAADAGVEEYLIEQDFTPGDPIDSVRQSVEFLRKTSVG